MKVLVVGSGAREHAIAWKLIQSPKVTDLVVAPGNAGTAQLASNVPINANDIESLLRFAQERHIDLTVVGPEAPLAAGIADRFQEASQPVFGPTKDAALIESSKSFAKELMLEHGVPTGKAKTFSSYAEASASLDATSLPIVVKADGLTAGKGVTVAMTRHEALEALRLAMDEKVFGPAGDSVLIEECLVGQEVSVFAFTDGRRVSGAAAACDYKRAGDGDVGPNTGGMGSFTPPKFWTQDLEDMVRVEIMEPVIRALSCRGTPYRGVLYAGLMLTAEGPKVLEFNCRLGDPEAQVILPRLKTDLADVMMGAAQGSIEGIDVVWSSEACVGVVVASGGYPGHYSTGYLIDGLDELDHGVTAFHAGTRAAGPEGPGVVTEGGRVLTVAAMGGTLDEARRKVYENVARIRFKDSIYRTDIAAVG